MIEVANGSKTWGLANRHGNVYARMARSKLIETTHLTEGEYPRRRFIVRFEYANGLIAQYDGASWTVIQPENEA